jgi:uncharacterized protein
MGHRIQHLDLFVTEACNLACPYCFAAAAPRSNPSLEGCLRLVDWLILEGETEKAHLTLWGGEPLLRAELTRQIVAHGRRRGAEAGKRVTFSMPTNATLLDEEVLGWIEENDVQIFLSIDGGPESQAGRPLRSGASSHELASKGLRRALQAGLAQPPSVRMTVTPDNVYALAANVRYFLDQGVRELLIYPALDQPWSPEAIERYAACQRALAGDLIRLVRRVGAPAEIPVLKAWRPILRRLLDGIPERRRQGRLPQCGAGTRMVAAGVDGSFSPCHRFTFYARDRGDRFDLGSLDRGLALDKGLAMGELTIEAMTGVTRCVDCELFDLCTYTCVAINYATTGALDRIPEIACRLMAAQIDGCKIVHSQLMGDPRYARFLGRSRAWALRRASEELGQRAWELYRSMREG